MFLELVPSRGEMNLSQAPKIVIIMVPFRGLLEISEDHPDIVMRKFPFLV